VSEQIIIPFANACALLGRLEAAIGMEPMNKGFAVLPSHFQSVQVRLLTSYSA
jgi:hypothetical protein